MALLEFNEYNTSEDNSLVITTIAALGAIGTTLAGTYFGYWLSQKAIRKGQREEEENCAKEFTRIVAQMKSELVYQIESFDKFIISLDQSSREPVAMLFTNRLEYVKSINRRNVVSHAIRQKGEKYSNRIRLMFDSISIIDLNSQKFYNYKRELEENVLTISGTFYTILKEFNNVFTKHYEGDDDKLDVYGTEMAIYIRDVLYGQVHGDIRVARKVIDGLRDINLKHKKHPLAYKLGFLVSNCYDQIAEIDRLTFLYKERFTMISDSFKQCYSALYEDIIIPK